MSNVSSVKQKSLAHRYVIRIKSRLKRDAYLRRTSKIANAIRESRASVGVDLGCGVKPRNEFGLASFSGIDFEGNLANNVVGLDISSEPLPFEDGSIDLVTAYDFIEHIPRWERVDGSARFPFIEVMNEIYRILKPGGLFYSKTPAFPHPEVFRDPTHVNIITEETFPRYFSGNCWASVYGFTGSFEVVEQDWDGPKLLTLLRTS